METPHSSEEVTNLDISDLGDEGSKHSQNTGGYLTLKAVSHPRTVES